tara:strand:- start:222 stop:599 length:378 start_codon:yes stop_codon:yes gene_type:complete
MQLFSPVGRLLIANIFLIDGINKISYYEGVAEWMFLKGVPEYLLPLVILLEIGGALAIILGWRVKLFSLLFFVFCILTAIIFHSDFTNNMDKVIFMKNMSMAGGFLFLFLHGGGDFSLDKRRKKF